MFMTGTNRRKSVPEITTGQDSADDWVKLSADSTEGIKQHFRQRLRRTPRREFQAYG